MENLDTKTLVHVGVELVVIGGLSFWFQRKCTLQQEEINGLKEEIANMKEIINRQGTMLANHERILNQLINGGGTMIHHNGMHTHHNQPLTPMYSHQGNTPVKPHSNNTIPLTNPPVTSQTLIEDEEDDIDEEELDKLLKEEIGNIQKSRNKSSGDKETIELECKDGVCELKEKKFDTNSDSEARTKKKRKKKKTVSINIGEE